MQRMLCAASWHSCSLIAHTPAGLIHPGLHAALCLLQASKGAKIAGKAAQPPAEERSHKLAKKPKTLPPHGPADAAADAEPDDGVPGWLAANETSAHEVCCSSASCLGSFLRQPIVV